ncbi:unnamed protein product [Rangifer tarandus platyrhynchus]|uniref:Uncharacterized protein n=1 Tax=Rangifer tarandus platyrhynchus TaxID=3082113 RepID=A0ABN8XIE2_RANTA|nr:unnamed protein product [Rangifer tarandus platyrhynchus]
MYTLRRFTCTGRISLMHVYKLPPLPTYGSCCCSFAPSRTRSSSTRSQIILLTRAIQSTVRDVVDHVRRVSL